MDQGGAYFRVDIGSVGLIQSSLPHSPKYRPPLSGQVISISHQKRSMSGRVHPKDDGRDEMAQQLQEIISKLYRLPADGPRQVFALSRTDAEKLPVLPSIAVISITAPERLPARIAEFTYVLRLSFADIDFLKPDLTERARGKLAQAFTDEQASVIRRFVESLPDDIRSVVIHCEGGYSRSCAVAVSTTFTAIWRHFNIFQMPTRPLSGS